MNTTFRKQVIVGLLSIVMAFTATMGGTAGAAPLPTATAAKPAVRVGTGQYNALLKALQTSSKCKTTAATTTCTFPGAGTISLANAPQQVQGLGGGGGIWHPYISLNRTDQQALILGTGAGIAAAICAIPAVGWAACGVAVFIVTVATVYVDNYGRCPTSKPNLRIYVKSGDQGRNGCYR